MCFVSGTSGIRKCVRPAGPGGKCGRPFTLCRKALVCGRGRVCRIQERKRCGLFPTFCDTGFGCMGVTGRKRCRKFLGVGKKCREPFRVCRKSLTCVAGRCRKPTIVDDGEVCVPPLILCKSGVLCTGPGSFSTLRCVRPGDVGASCSGPYNLCKSELQCGPRNICRVPS